MSTLSQLSPIFQMVAGVGLAFGIFKVPYVNKLKLIEEKLDVSERIASKQGGKVAANRLTAILIFKSDYINIEQELEDYVKHISIHSNIIIAINAILLMASGIWPDVLVHPFVTVLMSAGSIAMLGSIYCLISSKADALLHPLVQSLQKAGI